MAELRAEIDDTPSPPTHAERRPGGKRTARFAPIVLAAACCAVALLVDLWVYEAHFNWPPIRSDGFGYYVYLPAIFIHHDPMLRYFTDPAFVAAIHADYPSTAWNGLSPHGGGFLDKYPLGTAVMQLPFFLGAWAVAETAWPKPLSGFELPFQVATCLAGAVYFAAAVYLLFRIICRRTDIATAALCLIFVLTTTNVLLYASYDASLSHIYSFFLVSALCAVASASGRLYGRALVFGLVLGLAVIVRPTNFVAALLGIELVRDTRPLPALKAAAIAVCGAVLAALPQGLIWLETTGSLIYYSYQAEGFDFSRPQLFNYLFSIRKGVFFWHPAYLIMMLSLLAHCRRYPREAIIFAVMIAISGFVGASWHDWGFGGSFGSRQTVDVAPPMIIAAGSGLALLRDSALPRLSALARTLAVILAVVNLAQMYGYMKGKIPFDGTTWATYSRFWNPIPGITRALRPAQN